MSLSAIWQIGFEPNSPIFAMWAASSPKVGHKSPAQPVLEAVPNKTENLRRTKPSSRALRSEAKHRSGLRAPRSGAGLRGVAPTRFLGSFFGERQRMNINTQPRTRRRQCERKEEKLCEIQLSTPRPIKIYCDRVCPPIAASVFFIHSASSACVPADSQMIRGATPSRMMASASGSKRGP